MLFLKVFWIFACLCTALAKDIVTSENLYNFQKYWKYLHLETLSPIVKKQYVELMHAYKQKSNSKTKELMLAVFSVIEEDETIPTIARLFHKSYNLIKN